MRTCPVCKCSDYNNRDFVLMINECGHSLCRNCVDRLFSRQSAPCPVCQRLLKKNSFWQQLFDDPAVEKEVFFRKKLQKMLTLVESDFPDLRSYNDYLEKFENFVFNLANDRDVAETKLQVAEFAKEHEEQIARSRNRRTKDEEWIQAMLDEEAMMRRRLESGGADEQAIAGGGVSADSSEEQRGDVVGDDIISELMNSNMPAELIINNKKRQLYEKQSAAAATIIQRSGGAKRRKLTADSASFDVVKFNDGEKYEYTEKQYVEKMTFDKSVSQLAEDGFLIHVKPATSVQLAGGYHESIACLRALQEAYCDLFFLMAE